MSYLELGCNMILYKMHEELTKTWDTQAKNNIFATFLKKKTYTWYIEWMESCLTWYHRVRALCRQQGCPSAAGILMYRGVHVQLFNLLSDLIQIFTICSSYFFLPILWQCNNCMMGFPLKLLFKGLVWLQLFSSYRRANQAFDIWLWRKVSEHLPALL